MQIDIGVLTVVAASLVALTARAGWRLAARRASSQVAAVVALVWWGLLALPAVAIEVQHHRTQATATAVTRLVSGDPQARAVCTRRTADMLDVSPYAGRVMWDTPNVAVLRAGTCSDLAAWLRSDRSAPTLKQVMALHVLAHEAVHVAGVRSESVAECQAMQWHTRVAEYLGASPDVAARMAAIYRTQVFPHVPLEYRGGC